MHMLEHWTVQLIVGIMNVVIETNIMHYQIIHLSSVRHNLNKWWDGMLDITSLRKPI